jgi:hypothetical protein
MKNFVITMMFLFCATMSFASTESEKTVVDFKAVEVAEAFSNNQAAIESNVKINGCHFVTMCGHTGLACSPDHAAFYYAEWCEDEG